MSERKRPTVHIHDALHSVRKHCQKAGPLDPEEAERLADLLLRVYGADPEYPVRARLEDRAVETHSLDDPRDLVAREARYRPAPTETTPPSLQALIGRLLVAANLISPKQRAVARLYLWGFSLSEISELLGMPYTTAATRWRAAKHRLRAALDELTAEGMRDRVGDIGPINSEHVMEAFQEEQRRTSYEPPHHCPQGRERCAQTGICDRRGLADRRINTRNLEE